VGHPEGYTATDIIARYKRMRGFNVLHPMGWDAFGLPAEQYAIKTGQHPAITTRENIAKFKAQLKRIGFSYDWQREINTTDARYFRWTQWIFLRFTAPGSIPRRAAPNRSPPIAAQIQTASASLTSRGAGELVPGSRHGVGERGGHRRQERGGRIPGRAKADAPMDAADHRVCRALA
jgi:hypothetical protein